MKKEILFDLDGTIIESSECIFWVYRKLFEKYGLTLPDGEGMRRFIGPPVETTVGAFVEPSRVQTVSDDFREIYKTVDLIATNKVYDGIVEAIEAIKKTGRNVYVATSKNEPTAKKILSGFGILDLFDDVYGSRYDLGEKNRMKKSDIIVALMNDKGMKKEECILIGDTIFDVNGAKGSGIDVGIVRYGFGKEGDFDGEKIIFFADAPADLVKKLEEIDGKNH